ncbi:MAG TPA: vitamin B12-dependent ribonucleotide reductase, partial [Pirellulales bacterium]|nr:vitamin B12-dependent ribonucleotide reductase [Pirellulales bacterium]
FEPMGHTKNPDIRIAKSIVDYIFRWLGIEFLPGYREAMLGNPVEEPPAASSGTGDADAEPKLAATKAGEQTAVPGSATSTASAPASAVAKSPKGQNGHTPKAAADNSSLLERAGVMKVDLNGGGTFANRAEQFASFQTDAPSCDNCGAITVRNGNCYLCHNCGNSMGCS